jgi:anaerobic magnesium-protoporphyrin IX monomethyl ester cyclase
MRIAFISLLDDVSIPGLRYLSAYLKANGHDTVLILLPWTYTDVTLNPSNSFRYPYPDPVLEQVAEICRTSDLVGISMMTCHFDNAIHITNFLRKRLPMPIIWGGIHPTLRPDECLEYADMVCIGEGEISLCQLASEMSGGKPWESLSIPGIHKRNDKRPLATLPGPVIQDLDTLPLPDYDLGSQSVFYKGKIVRCTGDMLASCLRYSYRTLFSRGCPYACTYCCNNALRKLYGHRLPLRWRNTDNMLAELKAAVQLMPRLKEVELADDSFLTRSETSINAFAARYREEIGLPLVCIAVPRSVSEDKLRPLVEAGLHHFGIGVQSGSERISRELYSRPESAEEILSASACIWRVAREAKKHVEGRYDFILDNPWETEADIEASIRLCLKLKKPYVLELFSLTFYPETELYVKARKEGIVTDDLSQVYRRSQLTFKRSYLNGIFTLLSANAPNWVVSLLLRTRRLNPIWLPYLVASIFQVTRFLKRLLGYAVKSDWTLIQAVISGAIVSPRRPLRLERRRPSSRPMFCGGPGNTMPCQAQQEKETRWVPSDFREEGR